MIKLGHILHNLSTKILLISILFFCFLNSVNSQNESIKDVNNCLSGKYLNNLFDTKETKINKRFLQIFGRDNMLSDSIQLNIIDHKILKVEFKDKYGSCYELYEGKQKKNYFEFYLVKKRFYIPLFYSRSDIRRYRLKCVAENELEIKEYINNTSNILFMAAGGSSRNTYLLKK